MSLYASIQRTIQCLCLSGLLLWAASAAAADFPSMTDTLPPSPAKVLAIWKYVDVQPVACRQLPDPLVSLTGREKVTVRGTVLERYFLRVDNRDQYPDALFAPAPNLPPCGSNTNSARTWVDIVDQDGQRIYGFCALGSSKDLDGLWFAVLEGDQPPAGVRVVLRDRLCQEETTSNLVQISPDQFAPEITSDLELQSRWADIPPTIDGLASGSEWSGAGTLELFDSRGIKRGAIHAKNDDEHLFLLLDMTSDQTAGPSASDDYSGISFDIGMDGVKSPYVDLRFGTAAGTENLGLQWAVSQFGWTGLDLSTSSSYAEGYGPGPTSFADHKLFEYQIALSEIGVDFAEVLSDLEDLFQARMTTQVVSDQPAFTLNYPSHYSYYKQPMIMVALDRGRTAVNPSAPIVSGIGLVPRTFISQSTGLATTGPGHQINVADAPFGSHLRVMGNMDKIRSMGIQEYAVASCDMTLNGCGGLQSGSFDLNEWTFIDDTRANYYWDSAQGKYVLERVSPSTIYDAAGVTIKTYPTPSASLDWYLENLLFDWRTTGTRTIQSGLYKLHFFGFASDSILGFVSTPGDESSLVVTIDNTRPVMSVNSVSYQGASVDACAILQLDSAWDDLQVDVSAYDPDGYMRNFNLTALYGDNQRFSFSPDVNTYAEFLAEGNSGPIWEGAFPSETVACQGDAGDHWATTCGYTLRVSGWDRAINGYGRIHYAEAHTTITVILPGYSLE